MKSENTEYGFLYGPHLVVNRIGELPRGRYGIHAFTVGAEGKVLADVALVISRSGRAITIYDQKKGGRARR